MKHHSKSLQNLGPPPNRSSSTGECIDVSYSGDILRCNDALSRLKILQSLSASLRSERKCSSTLQESHQELSPPELST